MEKSRTFATNRSRHTSSHGECNRPGLRFFIMEYTKQALTLSQQIDILKQRGLIIDDETEATIILITEHFAKYDTPEFPPAWKTLEVLTLGTLSKLYTNFSDHGAKDHIARDFGLPQHLILGSWLASITVLRNKCAHHARVWNRRFPVMPILPRRTTLPWITNRTILPYKIYPHLCYIAYWLNSINPANTFAKDIKTLLAKYPVVDPAAMGMPRGWQSEPLWQ